MSMTSPNFEPDNLLPKGNFRDPRMEPGFCPECWPLCNGEVFPILRSDPHDRRCLELLVAYYQLNLVQKRILDGNGDPAELLAATEAIAAIEDAYSPIGFWGEPVLEGLFVRDIRVVRPGLANHLSLTASLSSQFLIPGIEQIPGTELTGQAQVRLWRHGEMDF